MITLSDLSFRYSKRSPLFEHLELTLAPGHIYGLLGKNGAGKTTLLKLICGLTWPNAGRISTGRYLPGNRQAEFLQTLFFLPEEVFCPAPSAEKLEKHYSVFYPLFDKNGFRSMLDSLDVGYGQKTGRLSYGQKKKVMIAFALACNTRYLFLDEPTNGLDIPSKATFRSMLASAFDEERIILISTHQVRDLQSLIDNILILDQGRILLNQSIEKVAEKLTFGHSSIPPAPAELIYAGNGELGQVYMAHNTQGEAGHVDLETLFNAAVSSPGKINSLFN